MTVYKIVIQEDSNRAMDVELVFYTSEELSDIRHVIERELAVYETREEYDDANDEED
jgi:hypothetical protein